MQCIPESVIVAKALRFTCRSRTFYMDKAPLESVLVSAHC